jgi:hypothetical protein
MGIIRSISHLSPCSGIQTSRMRVKRAFVVDNLMTSVLLVFEIVEYDNIGWPCIVDELLLFAEESILVSERVFAGYG